jgi:nucleoid-associated protein YgaU
MKKLTIVALSAFISLASCFASAVELAPNHPEFHVVQPGDTLWDISEKFLESPWLWPEIWHVNDQVENPHLIYPGDIISLVYIDGKPYLTKSGKGIIKLSPKARSLSADAAIATIPLDAILPFLTSAQVVTEEQLNTSPYVIGNDSERLLGAENNKAYVRGIQDEAISKYSFFRKGDNYIDPVTKELLGIEAIHVAEGQKILSGDPATILLKKSKQELLKGDLAWATNDDQLLPTYFPRAPKNFAGGQIISVYAGVQQIGQYDIVVINRGERENMEVGHVLSIYQRGNTIVDDIAKKRKDAKSDSYFSGADKEVVTLPDELAGRLMVFRTFEKVSLGLVLKATKSIHVLDKVKTPY